jgi:hypothetical protein
VAIFHAVVSPPGRAAFKIESVRRRAAGCAGASCASTVHRSGPHQDTHRSVIWPLETCGPQRAPRAAWAVRPSTCFSPSSAPRCSIYWRERGRQAALPTTPTTVPLLSRAGRCHPKLQSSGGKRRRGKQQAVGLASSCPPSRKFLGVFPRFIILRALFLIDSRRSAAFPLLFPSVCWLAGWLADCHLLSDSKRGC